MALMLWLEVDEMKPAGDLLGLIDDPTAAGAWAVRRADDDGTLSLEYVILDEAGAMLEPDALGTLLHGAKAVLLVGDHHQLPPFSKWEQA
eukprot:gene32809-41794_t